MDIDQLKILSELHILSEELVQNISTIYDQEKMRPYTIFARVVERDPSIEDRLFKTLKMIKTISEVTQQFHIEYQKIVEIVRVKDTITQLENNVEAIRIKLLETLESKEWAAILPKISSESAQIIADSLRKDSNNANN